MSDEDKKGICRKCRRAIWTNLVNPLKASHARDMLELVSLNRQLLQRRAEAEQRDVEVERLKGVVEKVTQQRNRLLDESEDFEARVASALGWDCKGERFVDIIRRHRIIVEKCQPVLEIVSQYSCECNGGIVTEDGVSKCVGCYAREAQAAENPT